MANRSVFPEQIDTFVEHYDIQASDVANVRRFQELKFRSSLSPAEQTELANLTIILRDKVFTPEDFNKMQDAITNLETFFRDNVQGYIGTKQEELNVVVENAKASVTNTANQAVGNVQGVKDQALIDIEAKKSNIIDYMDGTTAGKLRNDIGILGELTTEDKSSLVNAVNEINGTKIHVGTTPPTSPQRNAIWLDTSS